MQVIYAIENLGSTENASVYDVELTLARLGEIVDFTVIHIHSTSSRHQSQI